MKLSKKYVAKWLPVEGEIDKGDYFMHFIWGMRTKQRGNWVGRKWTLLQKGVDESPLFAKMFALFVPEHILKVKLFLCSYDIRPGDEYMFMTYDQEYVKTLIYKGGPLSDHWFKKLKIISKKAVWVKENDEFTIEEVQGYNDLMEYAVFPWEEGLTDPAAAYIRIFNHSCKNFH